MFRKIKLFINEIVTPIEALVVGLLAGVILGISSVLFADIPVGQETYLSAETLCEKTNNIDIVRFNLLGRIEYIRCKDGRVFEDF